MASSRKFALIFLVFVLLATTVSAVTIEQKELDFENIRQYGYAEKIIKISSEGAEPVQVSLSATEPIKKWITFEPESEYVSREAPVEFKVGVNPSDASIGIYQGYMIVNAIASGNALTTTISTAVDIKTTVRITDEEIMQANVEEVVIEDFEVGQPLKISILIENKGNIAMLPYFEMNILDVKKENLLLAYTSEEKTLNPSSFGLIEQEVPNELPVGKYYADINIRADGMLLRKHLLSFFIAEQGMIPEKQEPAAVETTLAPIPLSANWIILIVWALILVFIVWIIAKHNSKK